MTSNPIVDAMEKGQPPPEPAAGAAPSPPISPSTNSGSGFSWNWQKLLCRLGIQASLFISNVILNSEAAKAEFQSIFYNRSHVMGQNCAAMGPLEVESFG
jgi:hypothetical protein